MFSVQTDNIIKYERQLGKLNKVGVPFATRSTVNGAAFQTQKNAKELIDSDMITRNRFTVQSVQVEKAKGLKITTMESRVGSTQKYMEVQEFGGTKKARGRQGVPLATTYSSGEGMNSRVRKRLPRKPNKLPNIKLSRSSTGGQNRKQRNIIAIHDAVKSGDKYLFLDLGRTKGIFRIVGGRKNPKLRMVHSMENRTVRIPASPWLLPSSKRAQVMMPQMYERALQDQLNRLK